MQLWRSTVLAASVQHAFVQAQASCEQPTRLHLVDGAYDNYFYSDCNSANHVVLSSPLATSDLSVIKPRLLVAWPAGDSGVVALFEPTDGQAGGLGIQLINSTDGQPLQPIYVDEGSTPRVGVSAEIHFNASAQLTVAILGSIRNIRDYTEGGGILNDQVQAGLEFASPGGGASIARTWFDNVTVTNLTFTPVDTTAAVASGSSGQNETLDFAPGTYRFNASFNYPQLTQLQVLNPASQGLQTQDEDQVQSLSFLSYSEKLLAGTWRFLTYFGRDSMISALLLRSVLSEGEGGAVEAVISAVLERVNRTDGTACHEEVIGDFATLSNLAKGIHSTAPSCDYKMIDTDYYLPVLMKNYFVDSSTGRDRASALLDKTASFLAENTGLKYGDLAQLTAEKIMRTSAAFAADGGQTVDNLIHLNAGQPVGQWRDSNNGLGGGRVPYDVNTALVPAALRAIAALSSAGFFPDHADWNTTASAYAQIWEDETLAFFEVNVAQADAITLVEDYVSNSAFPGPSNTANITSNLSFYGLALNGSDNSPIVRVMHTDDCFRLFLLNSTNDAQLTHFINQTASHILQPFPVGLSTSVGLFVANPAYDTGTLYEEFTNKDYHGTVVWSWQLAMMAQGLARQLARCSASDAPEFCTDPSVHPRVLDAYTHLWDLIDANRAQLSGEVWSWSYASPGGFEVEALGALTSTESDVRQLWSLAFLAVRREDFS